MKLYLRIYLLLILLLIPVNVFANELQLKSGLNIIALDLGGPELDDETRANGAFGDATIIEQNGHYLLIDTGTDDENDVVINFLKENNIKNFSIYLSHYHNDHYGKIIDILKDPYFNVEKVYIPNPDIITSKLDDSKEWYDMIYAYVIWANNYYNNLTNIGTNVIMIDKGSEITVGDAKLDVIWDIRDSSIVADNMYNENTSTFKNRFINDTSLVSMLTYNNFKYLNAGDIEISVEEELLSSSIDLRADIFKFSHHGGRGSNMSSFIDAINPKYAYLPNNYTSGKNHILWYGDRSNGKFKDLVDMLTSKTNVLSTLYNGNIIYNVSPEGEITIAATRNYHTITIKYIDINNKKEISDDKTYVFNDASVFHLSTEEYVKEIPEYELYNVTNSKDNYELKNDIDIVCYYLKNGDYLKGDMNKNGKIDLSDIITLLKLYLNDNANEYEIMLGDIDNNASIGLNDIIELLMLYLNT